MGGKQLFFTSCRQLYSGSTYICSVCINTFLYVLQWTFIFLFFKLTEVKRQQLLLSALDVCKARGLNQILC